MADEEKDLESQAERLNAQDIRNSSRDLNSAASSGRFQGSSGRSREDEDLKDISSQADASEKDLNALEKEEITDGSSQEGQSIAYSDTDDDENEGLGDGNLGKQPGSL